LKAVFEQIQSLFLGQHSHVVVNTDGTSDVVRLHAGSFKAADFNSQAITELDRLSYTIHAIDATCTVVPVGSYKKNPLGEITRNEAFDGISIEKVNHVGAFQHLRPVENAEKRSMKDRKQDIYENGFLDNAAEAGFTWTAGSWTALKDTTQQLGVLRSRVWPGFVAFHRANTPIFGNFYYGNGVKNTDLAFMI
jgi:radial spoke head protein 9